MRLASVVVALCGATATTNTFSSEWLYAGFRKTSSVEAHQFFDAESSARPTPDSVRVWVKAITSRELERSLTRNRDALVELASRKLATGYRPRFLLLDSVEAKYNGDASRLQEAAIEITLYEAAAAKADAKTYSKAYFEIDCRQQRMRTLEVIAFTRSGDARTGRLPPQDFQFIAPDSIGQWLSQMLCPQ